MPIGSTELAAELKTLRKGRGLQTPRLTDQVGPALRALCGIAETETSASAREKLTKRLGILAGGLPDDLRLVVTTVLALHSDSQRQFLQDRVQSLAELQQRDVRTIRRRMDEGFALLAEIATAPAGQDQRASALGWYVDRFEATLRMDKPVPECFERRRIVAEREGLDVIQATITLPKVDQDGDDDHDLFAELYYGAVLLGKQRKAETRFAFDLGLPRALSIGEKHEYGIIMRVPDHQSMRSHYVFVPDRRCDEFELRVRFDPKRPPSKIWRVNEVFHREVDEVKPTEPLIELDHTGEINLSFDVLLPGHGYGVQWIDG